MLTLCLRLDEKIWRCICILVFLLSLADGLFIESDELVVNTKWGSVRGKWSRTVRNRIVANFLGIPYALPPVGDLRFRSPQRWNRTWTEIRDASIDGKKCLQIDNEIGEVIGSEDCLYLNIFVPIFSEKSVSQRSAKLPVLVYVHGGAYEIGSSDSKLYAPDYLLDQDIISVTLNYRLSALGFFSTANQISPGNYGLKDIKMALEWVQKNIHSFEGNPKSVTLMGHSAGSSATHILALSKKTTGLFHRYILLSGSALCPWSYHPPRRYRQVCLQLAKLVGCPLEKNHDVIASNETTTKNSKRLDVKTLAYDNIAGKEKDDEEIMKCMRMADANRIIAMTRYLSVWRNHPTYNFGPTLEDESADAILTMHPLKIMKNGLFRDMPAIMQVVKDEGLGKKLSLLKNPEIENELIENFEEYLPYYIMYHEVISNTSAFASAIQNFYFNGNVTLGLTHNITEMTTDALITWPMFQALQYMSKVGNSNIYFSYFAYEGTFSTTFASGILNRYGVAHGDDMNYLFPILNNMYHNMLLNNTMSDITMINIMTEMVASFVAEGIPQAWFIIPWPNYRDHHEFMKSGIDKSPEFTVQTNFMSERMQFWEKLMHNELEKVMNDVFFDESPKNKSKSNVNAIDCRLIIQLTLLAIFFFYI